MVTATLFNGSCDFVAGVAKLDMLPPLSLPEIAFAGRSNVGKSSLINALTGRKTLARTSHTPGRTQQLNFFNMRDTFLLVDMPGYGYAKVSKSMRKSWDTLIRTYLRGRSTLRCVFLLVDSRHGLKDSDIEMMKMMDETAVNYRIILTKSDEIKQSERAEILERTALSLKKHPAAFPQAMLCSAHKQDGLEDIRAIVEAQLSII
ncbi:MAG: YihA family ribosome biogenesis GTP-binding protein [Rhodospirillales bacterium]|nr:YihA family ribosome biogenesis GTP-binding protein [Rhodospirillales bacterium]MCB9979940.1 YihA family ribosome biogenesis GTP-binding protein [Rhodospirillales bacterium]